ncbi:PREDICTED: cytochrome P450 18a1 [Vollenhovia emeryi]|uniref:cytochrome P450 18a1 n=1 Tax=Vollenhovia emeryi TaxID=411798 RepID=UPI0005F3986A|nr:PREDICTED: cytochrome P450 18a1 [Vollenhovia emeryi]
MLVNQVAQYLLRPMGSIGIPAIYLLLIALLVGKLVFDRIRKIRHLPPGPWGLPICGYIPFIKDDLHLCYDRLAKKYGSVFSVRLGSELAVVISDPSIIREAFNLKEFSGRPHTDFMNIIDGYGIVNTEGSLWRSERMFLHKNLRRFGMTKSGSNKDEMEQRIQDEVRTFLQVLRRAAQHKVPTNISPALAVSISNVICSLTMSVRFDHDDWRFRGLMNLIDEGFILFGSLNYANSIPALRYLPWIHTTRSKIEQNRSEMVKFFQDIINQHRADFDENNIRDIVDTYLHGIQQAKNENREHELFQGKDADRQMQQIMGDLFSAGMETVKTTLEWCVVFMLHYPEAAKAVQDELDAVVGRSRLPTLKDSESLPITNATIHEIIRKSHIVPLGTTHATTRNVNFRGYTIPAGTHVIPLLYTVHMNEAYGWDEPEDFRPSRFINPEGKFQKPKNFMPFGVGRRVCLGEVLASMEIFMFFSSLMHTFNLSLPEGATLPSLRGNFGVTMTPERFEVRLALREGEFDLGDYANVRLRPNGN